MLPSGDQALADGECALRYIDGVKLFLAINNKIVGEFQKTADTMWNAKLINKPVDCAKTMLDVAPLKIVLPPDVTYCSHRTWFTYA